MILRMPLWWSVVVLVAMLLGLAGCDSPSPGFGGYPKREVTVDGSRFSVHYSPYRAEAIRLNPEWPPRRAEIVARAERAIALASGCKVVPGSVRGDAALVKADLKCAGAPESGRPPRQLGLDCDVAHYGGGGRPAASEIDCVVVEF